MVGTRRRSAVTQEDVNAAIDSMDAVSSTRRNKRLSEVGAENVTTRTRSPRTSSASATKSGTENKHLAGALQSEVVASPAKIRSPRTSASSKTAETLPARPSTPTRAGRLSEVAATGRPGTPTRLKRLSESLNVTPSRRSRRLSGSAPEEVDTTPVLPLKKRRTSTGLDESIRDNEIIEEPSNMNIETVVESNLEVIDENEEEEALVKTPKSRTPVKAKTPAEKTPVSKSKNSANVETPVVKTPVEKAKTPAKEKTPEKAKTPAKAETPVKAKTPLKPETPVKAKTLDEKTSVEKAKTSAKGGTPVKEETPVKEKTPAKAETPVKEETPKVKDSPKKSTILSTASSTVSADYASAKESLTSIGDSNQTITEVKDVTVVEEVFHAEPIKEETELKPKNINSVENKAVKKLTQEEQILLKLRESLINRIPKQLGKSRKFQKMDPRGKFRLIRKDKGLRPEYEKQRRMREERDRVRNETNEIKAEKAKKKEELRARIAENKKKKEINERKAEIYQVVKNPNKIKRMKKKDLVRRDLIGAV